MLSAIQIASMPLSGLGNGVQPIVSYNYGRGDSARIKKTVKIVSVAALCFSSAVWAVSVAAPRLYCYIFSAEPEVAAIVERYMPYFMAGTIFYFAQMCLQNVFVALDQAAISIFLACLRKVILLIPLCFLLPYEFGVAGVYYSEGIADVTAGIITATTFYAMLPRILKKRENKLAAQSAAEKESEDTSA